ncbi:YeiH family protein [Tsuneonella sp. SYSU-LHT278]|uniref:YeiH family protein n=1 Tax=Tsuneonella sediminis TaxID=3416089 RepID=UPI003F7A7CE3
MTPSDNSGYRGSTGKDELPYAGDLFGEIYLAETAPVVAVEAPRWAAITRFLPGFAIVGVAAGTSAWLAEHYGFPIILLGLLIGLALNFVAREQSTHAGLDFASRTCLRWGIVALGLQVTFAQVMDIGPWPFAALVAIMGLAFAAGVGGAAISGQSRYAGILAGGATAICGASAALALYGIIGRDRLSQAQFALTLVGVSLASALAMSLYPAIAGEIGLTDSQAGFLIGASIHDVAQAIGGGFTYSDAAGAEATIIKLSRVAMLGPVMILVALWIGNSSSEAHRPVWRRIAVPWFIAGFVLLVAVNSTGVVPASVQGAMMIASKTLLLLAVIATAMRSDMARIMQLGWRAATPVACATLASFLAACGALYFGVTS